LCADYGHSVHSLLTAVKLRGFMHTMATNEVPRGPISGYAMANVRRLREARAWSLPRLSEELDRVGRGILPTGIHRLENGRRRVDVDDLIALGLVFGVSPITLLLPPVAEGEIELTDKVQVDAATAWNWLQARRPVDVPEDEDDAAYAVTTFLRNSLPKGIRSRYPATKAGRELLQEDYPDVLKVTSVAEFKAAQEARRLAGEEHDGEH